MSAGVPAQELQATDIIRGPYSSRQFATTLVDPVPSTTSISGITSITARSLYVSWSTCSRASKYYIDYRRSSSSYWMTVEVGNVRSTQITNLLPSTTYYFPQHTNSEFNVQVLVVEVHTVAHVVLPPL
jgi:hypothetical protein